MTKKLQQNLKKVYLFFFDLNIRAMILGFFIVLEGPPRYFGKHSYQILEKLEERSISIPIVIIEDTNDFVKDTKNL